IFAVKHVEYSGHDRNPRLITTFHESAFQPFCPRRKMKSARESFAGNCDLAPNGWKDGVRHQTCKCWKSIPQRIGDFDQPRSTSKAGPYSWTGAALGWQPLPIVRGVCQGARSRRISQAA